MFAAAAFLKTNKQQQQQKTHKIIGHGHVI